MCWLGWSELRRGRLVENGVGCEVDRWRVCVRRNGSCRKVSARNGFPWVLGRSGKVNGATRGMCGRVGACGCRPSRVMCL